MTDKAPELAFYYPNPVWRDSDWVKNLILFFDRIALLVPDYMRERPFLVDPAIATGLQEHGLLTILEPESFIDQKASEALATTLADILVSGALDPLAQQATTFHELSYSRLGSMGDEGLARLIFDELKKRGLARPSEDGVSIPMHPMVRSLILVLLAQILRTNGRERGLDLCPATDNVKIHSALKELLGLPRMPSASHVVSLDLQTVGIDLSAVPLDEVLRFRADHREEYRNYARDLQRVVQEIGDLPVEEQKEVLQQRQAQLQETTKRLSSGARRTWRKRASFALTIAGATWRFAHGDIVGGLLAFGAGTVVADLSTTLEAGAFSYLFMSKARFSS